MEKMSRLNEDKTIQGSKSQVPSSREAGIARVVLPIGGLVFGNYLVAGASSRWAAWGCGVMEYWIVGLFLNAPLLLYSINPLGFQSPNRGSACCPRRWAKRVTLACRRDDWQR